MAQLSSADHSVSPPRVSIPRRYNAAHDLIERNLRAGRGERLAFIDDRGAYTYAELARRVNRFASSLAGLGLRPEDRAMVCMLDTIDWPVAFLGAIKAGVVPVAVNTLLKPQDYEYMLRDSRARVLFVSQALLPSFEGLAGKVPTLVHTVVSAAPGAARPGHAGDFDALLAGGSDDFEPADTVADEPCFWLYSSGSTGAPKGTVHVHSSLIQTAELFARPVIGIRESDIVFSAAKLFFAYGLGNGLTFPMSVGATAVLMAERPTPEAVFLRLTGEAPQALAGLRARPTVHYGVPTLFASMLASPSFPARERLGLRVATSAGEALPARVGTTFTERTGVEILDGIGSTEMLHVFLSNRAGEVRYGTTGKPVPGYALKLLGDDGQEVDDGEVGDLYIGGPSAAAMYWNQREKTRQTFQGEWTRSGDKYVRDADGYYTYAGRSDDMLKVSGQYVSPFEVESAIASHPEVLEAAVVGAPDDDRLIKPKAYVVLKEPAKASPALAEELRSYVKDRLAPFKYPRWVEFVDELPKTATGKIQRFKLRA
ncbi:MAG: benzoate-CoA ligase family protein [Burkholderiaceae bacterium]|nr:benzoate-CoA ligase family protein [Burkholderiaceae bacterium]